MEKHSVSRLSYLFAPLDFLSSEFLFFDLISSSLLFSDSSHLCFSSVHIVGSLTSKLPSIINMWLGSLSMAIFHSFAAIFFQTSSLQPTDAPNQPLIIGHILNKHEQTVVQTVRVAGLVILLFRSKTIQILPESDPYRIMRHRCHCCCLIPCSKLPTSATTMASGVSFTPWCCLGCWALWCGWFRS